jgi:hypothetical protein
MNQDLEHLKWLSIGFYINAGLTALFACIPFVHLFMGIAIVTHSLPGDSKGGPPPAVFGWFFIVLGAFFILCGWALAICFFLAGRYLKGQTRYVFCMVMAAFALMFAPLGTILGVFTIIVLLRDSVKDLFNGNLSVQVPNQSFDPPNWR